MTRHRRKQVSEQRDLADTDLEDVERPDNERSTEDWEPSPETVRRLYPDEHTVESISQHDLKIENREGTVAQERQASEDQVELLGAESSSMESTEEVEKPARAERMLDRMMAKKGIVDLSRPADWGKYAHAAIQDYYVEEIDPHAEIEKRVEIPQEDGTSRTGRIDILYSGGIVDVKAADLGRMTDSQFSRFLEKTASQIEDYQNSPALDHKPEAEVLFEFTLEDPERRTKVEDYFRRRGIRVSWGTL